MRSRARSGRSTTRPARAAKRAPACSSRRRSTTSSSAVSARLPSGWRSATRSRLRRRSGRW